MFYSRLITSENFVETIRSKNIYKECANAMKEECLNVNFELSNTFCDTDDIDKSYDYLENNIPDHGTYSSKTFLTHTVNQDAKNVKL